MVKISRRESRKEAIILLYQSDLMKKDIKSLIQTKAILEGNIDSFTRQLAIGTFDNKAEIDKIIEGVVKNWTLDRIAIIDRNILRVAIYEMFHMDDIPLKVSVDEAIEIAKEMGQKDDTPKFVNGILGKVYTDISSKK